jgi:hypothetical protein
VEEAVGTETLLVLSLTIAAVAFAALHRFTRMDGRWMRRRPRRRWPVGAALYRRALGSGFRYSVSRRALVPRVLNGRFGPVLVRRAQEEPSLGDGAARRRPAPPAAPYVAPALPRASAAQPPPPGRPERQTPAPRRLQPPSFDDAHRIRVRRMLAPRRTIDVACRALPQHHRGARLWQLTAIDVRSGYAWADLVRRRGGPPTAQQVGSLLDRVDRELSENGKLLDAISVPLHALPMFDGVVLPAGVRLVVPDPMDDRGGAAVALHELFVVRHWRSAFEPPAAPALDDLRRRLDAWLAAYNAGRDEPVLARRWLLPLQTS